jgi:hypothetical protein
MCSARHLRKQLLERRPSNEALHEHDALLLQGAHVRAGDEERVPHADDAPHFTRRARGHLLTVHEGTVLAAQIGDVEVPPVELDTGVAARHARVLHLTQDGAPPQLQGLTAQRHGLSHGQLSGEQTQQPRDALPLRGVPATGDPARPQGRPLLSHAHHSRGLPPRLARTTQRWPARRHRVRTWHSSLCLCLCLCLCLRACPGALRVARSTAHPTHPPSRRCDVTAALASGEPSPSSGTFPELHKQ